MASGSLRLSGMALLLAGLAGCRTAPGVRVWGSDVRYLPTGDRFAAGAGAALRDPWTWVPLIGAGVFTFGDLDEDISDWAQEETPIFGSPDDARRWSDNFRETLRWTQYGSTLLAPAGPDWPAWWKSKAEGLVLASLAEHLTSVTTSAIKSSSDRERPDGKDDRSFPSGHSSGSASNAAWTVGVLPAFDLEPRADRATRIVVRGLAVGTAWARVEAGRHYPTDVLAGAALGNFLAVFVQGAFLGEGPMRLEANVEPDLETVIVGLRWSL